MPKPVITPQPRTPAAPPPAAAPGSPTADPTYVIGPEDNIAVNVWNEPKVSGTLPVRPDGMISLPLVGDMPAAGRTPMQLAAEITVQLQKLITDPNVTVSVLGVNSKRIYLAGQVARVGPMTMTPNMTVLQALLSAGGPSEFANKKHIFILRTEGSKQLKIPFDYNKAVKTGNMQGVTLIPGDTIVVP